jgi:hypothetical protein
MRRADHFLLRHLDPAVRSARYATRLRIADEKVAAAIDEAKGRLFDCGMRSLTCRRSRNQQRGLLDSVVAREQSVPYWVDNYA